MVTRPFYPDRPCLSKIQLSFSGFSPKFPALTGPHMPNVEVSELAVPELEPTSRDADIA